MINQKMSTHCGFKKTFSLLANQERPSHLLPTVDESLRPSFHNMTLANGAIVRLELNILKSINTLFLRRAGKGAEQRE
jgi:hypothetical protein